MGKTWRVHVAVWRGKLESAVWISANGVSHTKVHLLLQTATPNQTKAVVTYVLMHVQH